MGESSRIKPARKYQADRPGRDDEHAPCAAAALYTEAVKRVEAMGGRKVDIGFSIAFLTRHRWSSGGPAEASAQI